MSAQPDTAPFPPDIKKRCSKCRVWYPANTNFFYGKSERSKLTGERLLDCYCKKCRLAMRATTVRYRNESGMARSKRQARLRARQRAWVRLAQLYPEMMDQIFHEELEKEGWDGDEDLRKGANRRKGNGVYARVRCKAVKSCGWTGTRKVKNYPTRLPCPKCGRKVERP